MTANAVAKSMRGAIPGPIVVAAILLLLDGWSGVVIGAGLGGAAFGAVIDHALRAATADQRGDVYRGRRDGRVTTVKR